MKQVLGIYSAPNGHWVGNGFPVRTLFSYQAFGRHISPFLLLDYAGPTDFEPATARRGVGRHPHRGFETVTIVYQGELAHRDSTGAGGHIGPGDVQWMTAGAGILHEEYHADSFTRSGGTLEMVQLWINLPARQKLAAPSYQTLLNEQIPRLPLSGNAGDLRVIAGLFGGVSGAARTFTELNVWDVSLHQGKTTSLPIPEQHTGMIIVLRGTLLLNGNDILRESQLALLERVGSGVQLEANQATRLLVLSGQPIDEPIVGHGPFVMNTDAEIAQALADFKGGRFGEL